MHLLMREVILPQGHIGRLFCGHTPLALIHIRAIHFFALITFPIKQPARFIRFLRCKNSLYIKRIILGIGEILRVLQHPFFAKGHHHHIGRYYLYGIFIVAGGAALYISVCAFRTKTAPSVLTAARLAIYPNI